MSKIHQFQTRLNAYAERVHADWLDAIRKGDSERELKMLALYNEAIDLRLLFIDAKFEAMQAGIDKSFRAIERGILADA
jgi:hypothetical protein